MCINCLVLIVQVLLSFGTRLYCFCPGLEHEKLRFLTQHFLGYVIHIICFIIILPYCRFHFLTEYNHCSFNIC